MKFPFFCLLKEFPRDHDQIFAGSRPAALLLALILLPLSYILGTLAAAVIAAVTEDLGPSASRMQITSINKI